MDLSPAQDGSYVKPLTITLDPAKSPAEAPGTFTGTVYGGSPFDNGVIDASQAPAVFSFTSDMDAQMGGPYFWVGRLNADGTLGGAVRSLNRGFNMHWSAHRSMNP